MVALETPPVERGWNAVDFYLDDANGKTHHLYDLVGEKGLVIMFISNHCPYVQAIISKVAKDMAELKALGINAVAIGANDIQQYPEDAPKGMKQLAAEHHFSFPYLFDETQQVARAYDAVCTPDFYGFNKDLELQYRGRFDEAGMQKMEGARRELFHAMKMIAETGKGPDIQHPSIGCSIKWRPGPMQRRTDAW